MYYKKIGVKNFGGIINVTDPCYDKGEWDRIDISVKNGIYECYVGLHRNFLSKKNSKNVSEKIKKIGIYLDGFIPSEDVFEKMGEIGVDSGMAGFFINKPDYPIEAWLKFCDSVIEGNSWIKDEGFFSFSGYGDGVYPLYVYKNEKNEITSAEIRYIR